MRKHMEEGSRDRACLICFLVAFICCQWAAPAGIILLGSALEGHSQNEIGLFLFAGGCLLSGMAGLLLARLSKRRTISARRASDLRLSMSLAFGGCLAVLLGHFLPHAILLNVGLTLVAFGGASCQAEFAQLASLLSEKLAVIVVLAWTTLLCIVCWSAALCGATAAFAACAALMLVSLCALLLGYFAFDLPYPEGRQEPDCMPLAQRAARELILRYGTSLFILGFVTAFMTYIYGFDRGVLPDLADCVYLLVAPVALLFFMLIPRVAKKSLNITTTYSLLLVIGLVAFFPINPGSVLSQRHLMHMLELWYPILIGVILIATIGIVRAVPGIGNRLRSTSTMALSSGALLSMLFTQNDWLLVFLDPYSETGVVNVCIVGLGAIVLVYVATLILVNGELLRRTLLAFQNTIVAAVRLDDRDADSKPIEKACHALSLKYGLSPREIEAFVILAQGHALKRVQEELVVAEGTAITHRRNIYRKLGVHSRQEMIDLVHAFMAGEE